MILVIDNFDSFTFNLVDYFKQLGLEVDVQRNNVSLRKLAAKTYAGVVLSPGPGIPEDAGNLMDILEFFHTSVPILGICLGHQAVATFFGGQLQKARKPMHGKISAITHDGDALFQHLPSRIEVVRYHSLVCENIESNLKVIAKTDAGEVMALKHNDLPIYGLQFHPEAVLTQYGLEILGNWKNINSICN